MTLSTTTNTATYTGDASTVAFSFPYLFYANGDLVVTIDGTVRTLNGGGTYDYQLSGAGNNAGGTVTVNNAPTNGMSVVIQRVVDYVQETDLENFDGNPADVTEKQFDLCVMMAQQLQERVARAILAPIGTALTSNNISGTITASNKAIVISTAGPAVAELSSFGDDIDVVLTGLASNDMLKWNGTSWVNFTQVATTQIADGAVTTAKIADGAVTTAKIADGAVTAAKISSGLSTDGQVLTSDGAGDAAWETLIIEDSIPNAGYVADRYYFGGNFPGGSELTVTANTLYFMPFIVGDSETFTRIGFRTITGATGNARLGIYNMVGGLPTTLVLDAGTVSTAGAANKEVTISQLLTPGIYGLAVVFDATPGVDTCGDLGGLQNHIVGASSSVGSGSIGGNTAFTYGALGAWPGVLTRTGGGDTVCMWLRKV